jgi:hypothetical protein
MSTRNGARPDAAGKAAIPPEQLSRAATIPAIGRRDSGQTSRHGKSGRGKTMQNRQRAVARSHAVREANIGGAFILWIGAFASLVLALLLSR